MFYSSTKPKPPDGLTLYKGEIHGLFSHNFVEYIVNDPVSKTLLEWVSDTSHASEHYWNTLNYNQHLRVPGGFLGNNIFYL